MKNNFLLKSVITFMLLLLNHVSSATTSEQMSMDQLIHSSEACVMANVNKVTFAKEDGGVFTYTEFKVKERAFGSTPDTITVKTPGGEGQLGRLLVSEVVPGAPRFIADQDSILFLSHSNQNGDYLLTGFSQGAMNVRTGGSGSVVELGDAGEVSTDEAMDMIQQLRSNDATN